MHFNIVGFVYNEYLISTNMELIIQNIISKDNIKNLF